MTFDSAQGDRNKENGFNKIGEVMKKLYILIIFTLFSSSNLFSQLNDAATYFPLKPGNKWVYTYYNTQFGQSGRLSRQSEWVNSL